MSHIAIFVLPTDLERDYLPTGITDVGAGKRVRQGSRHGKCYALMVEICSSYNIRQRGKAGWTDRWPRFSETQTF
jgi:hypothetical protein